MNLSLAFTVLSWFLFYKASSQPLSLISKNELQYRVDLIYQGEYLRASEIYSELPQSQKKIEDVLEIFSLRWKYVPVQLSEKKDEYLTKIIETNKLTQNDLDTGNSMDAFLYVSTEIFLAEFYLASENTVKAMWHAKKVYPIILRSFTHKWQDPEFLFLQGLYLYYIDHYSHKGFFYRSALSMFKKGNRDQGLTLLKNAANQKSIAQTEALIYLSHIYLNFEGKPFEALPYSKKLAEKYPSNLKFKELYIKNLLAVGQYLEANELLIDQLTVDNPYFKIPALFFSGCYSLDYKQDTLSAKSKFNKCIESAIKRPSMVMYKEMSEKRLASLNQQAKKSQPK